MQAMQRQLGRLTSRAPGDNAKVAVVLTDYEDADTVLAKVQYFRPRDITAGPILRLIVPFADHREYQVLA